MYPVRALFVSAISLAIITPSLTIAPQALADDGAELLELRLPSFWSGPSLVRRGSVLDLDYVGNGYETIFAGAPEALDHASVYRAKRIAGVTLYAAALGSLVAELIVLLVQPDALGTDTATFIGNSMGWLAGSATVAAIGLAITQSANDDLNRAVDAYNADSRRGPPSLGLKIGGRF